MVLLLIVLLTLGLCSVPAMAGDQAVIQPLPATCQPVSDVELTKLSGRLMTRQQPDLGYICWQVQCAVSKCCSSVCNPQPCGSKQPVAGFKAP
jgi:hypothetical protein